MKGIDPNEYLTLPELFKSEKPKINIDKTAEVVETINDGLISEESEEKPPVIYLRKDEICYLTEKTSYAVSNDEYRPAMAFFSNSEVLILMLLLPIAIV
jgi:hypothetical protein